MTPTKVLRDMLIVFHQPNGRYAAQIAGNLLHSQPGGKGNALASAYNALTEAEHRRRIRFLIGIVRAIYSASRGLSERPSKIAIQKALEEAESLIIDIASAEKVRVEKAILANHRAIMNGQKSYVALFEELLGEGDKAAKDAFRAQCKRVFKQNNLPIRPQKVGRKSPKETF
jgi:hypothetical protein